MIHRCGPLVLLLAVPACADGDGRVPVVVYSPHGEEILGRFERLFEEAHPEADVRRFNMPSNDCLTRLRAEARNPSCDVFWGATTPLHAKAAEEGLLEPYVPTWADAVDPRFRTGDERYHAQFVMLQVILYNDRRMREGDAPRGWMDLVSERFADRVILRLPPASGTMVGTFSWLIAWQAGRHGGDVEAGFNYLRALHRNTRRYTVDSTELFEAITKDESNAVSIWNFTDALFQNDEYGYPLGVKVPEEGVPVVVDCIALVRKNPGEDPRRAELARAFYEFVSSIDASETLVREHFRIPARADYPDERKPDWLRALRYEPLPADAAFADAHAAEWMTRWDERIKPLDH